jgi:hypothetical protein
MNWPPLIESASVPRWVVARDRLVTLAAWALLLHFLQDMAWMAAYWVAFPWGVEVAPPWKPGKMWWDMVPFLKAVALVVVWLIAFMGLRWHLLTSHLWVVHQPEPLPPAQQARAMGLSREDLDLLRGAAMATVRGVDQSTGRADADTVVSSEPMRPDET